MPWAGAKLRQDSDNSKDVMLAALYKKSIFNESEIRVFRSLDC